MEPVLPADVGDDQQIALDAIGVEVTEVARLQSQHLDAMPSRQEFGARIFAGHQAGTLPTQ